MAAKERAGEEREPLEWQQPWRKVLAKKEREGSRAGLKAASGKDPAVASHYCGL